LRNSKHELALDSRNWTRKAVERSSRTVPVGVDELVARLLDPLLLLLLLASTFLLCLTLLITLAVGFAILPKGTARSQGEDHANQ
jgi:hypothetical protein